MIHKLFSVGLLAVLGASLGCAMCCSPDDPNYGAYGGRWQRLEMATGRVGSAFAEAGYDSLATEPSPTPGESDAERQPGDDGVAQGAAAADEADREYASYIR